MLKIEQEPDLYETESWDSLFDATAVTLWLHQTTNHARSAVLLHEGQ